MDAPPAGAEGARGSSAIKVNIIQKVPYIMK